MKIWFMLNYQLCKTNNKLANSIIYCFLTALHVDNLQWCGNKQCRPEKISNCFLTMDKPISHRWLCEKSLSFLSVWNMSIILMSIFKININNNLVLQWGIISFNIYKIEVIVNNVWFEKNILRWQCPENYKSHQYFYLAYNYVFLFYDTNNI